MSKYLPDFAGVFCLVIFLISLATIDDGLLRDGDSFWHIKAGSVMLEKQGLIDSDIFSHTAFGTPWTAHEWLSEVIMASVHKLAGLEGVFCFFVLISSLAFWLLFKITEKDSNQWVAFGCVSLALVFSAGHMAARPHLFTWLFMLITMAILTSGGKRRYWLPVVMVIWANLHGGFIVGLVLQAIFIIGSSLEKHFVIKAPYRENLYQQSEPTLFLLLSVLAVGLNPFGYELLAFPFQVSQGAFSLMIGEWQTPDLQKMWYFRVYLVALVVLISLRKSSVTWTERLLVVFFLNAALTHMRHVSLMLIALTPFMARMVGIQLGNWSNMRVDNVNKKQLQLSARSGPLVTIVIALVLLISGSNDRRFLTFMTPKNIFGVEAGQMHQLVGYLDKNLPAGNMYNEYSLGGYLLYALTPPPKVFIDGRADMYGEQILTDYSAIASSSTEREKLLEKYEVGWVVFDKDSPLTKDLIRSDRWKPVYTNSQYMVFVKQTEYSVL